MALEQVRRASKVLGPLLRRRGTSPALGATLRKALGLLDKSLGGLDAGKQAEVVQAGISELRACLSLIQASDHPADHEQLAGITAALAALAPEESAADPASTSLAPIFAPADPSSEQARPTGQVDPARPTARGRRPAKPPAFTFTTVDAQLLGLAARLQFLHVAASEPLFRSADAEPVQAELRRQAEALAWLGAEHVPEILRAVDQAGSLEDRLVAGATLLHLGAARGVEWLVAILERAAGSKPFPAFGATLLRTLASTNFLDSMLKAFLKPATAAVSAALLPLLAEHGMLPREKLWELASHPSDEVAVPAAHALAWSPGGHDTPVLLGWAGKAGTAARANAMLFAAVGLGSVAALAEVRTRLRGAGPVDPQLVDALALAGDRSDAVLLMAGAARPDADAAHTVLAAAHLGCVETLEMLPSLAERVSPRVLDEARCMITGHGSRTHPGEARPDPAVRALRGRPWSVSGLFARLAAPHESLHSQRRFALELRVRTGLPLPEPFPTLAATSARAKLVASLETHFAKTTSRLPPGGWYYQGKPTPADVYPS